MNFNDYLLIFLCVVGLCFIISVISGTILKVLEIKSEEKIKLENLKFKELEPGKTYYMAGVDIVEGEYGRELKGKFEQFLGDSDEE